MTKSEPEILQIPLDTDHCQIGCSGNISFHGIEVNVTNQVSDFLLQRRYSTRKKVQVSKLRIYLLLTAFIFCLSSTQAFSQKETDFLIAKSRKLLDLQNILVLQLGYFSDTGDYDSFQEAEYVAHSTETAMIIIQSTLDVIYLYTCMSNERDRSSARPYIAIRFTYNANQIKDLIKGLDRHLTYARRQVTITSANRLKAELQEILEYFESLELKSLISGQNDLTESNVNRSSEETSKSAQSKSPFIARYVGGNGPPEVEIFNDTDRTLNLTLGQRRYVIAPRMKQNVTLQPGTYNFRATASGVIPLEGTENFERGHVYSWNFRIVVKRRVVPRPLNR